MKTSQWKRCALLAVLSFAVNTAIQSHAPAAPSDQGLWHTQLPWTDGAGFLAVHMVHLPPVNPTNHLAPGSLLIWGFDHNGGEPRRTHAKVFRPADPSAEEEDQDSLSVYLVSVDFT